jgi:hypothetical protein
MRGKEAAMAIEIATIARALEPFANAYARLEHYGDDAHQQAPVFIDANGCEIELLAADSDLGLEGEERRITVADLKTLRDVYRELNGGQ